VAEPVDAADLAPVAVPAAESETAEVLDAVLLRLTEVQQQVSEFHRRSAHRESVIDRLHAENQTLKEGTQKAILEPVIADLIRLYDALRREAARGGGPIIASFADDVELILDRCGIEVVAAEPGAVFETGVHTPASVVATADPARHNTIAEVLAAGLRDRETGRTRRAVRARIHQFTPPADNGQAAQDQPTDDRPADQTDQARTAEEPADSQPTDGRPADGTDRTQTAEEPADSQPAGETDRPDPDRRGI